MQPSTPLSGDAAQVAALLAWALENGVSFERVAVGGCSVELAAAHPAAPERRRPDDDRRARESIYNQFGGDLMAHVVSSGNIGIESPLNTGDDMEPVLGGGR